MIYSIFDRITNWGAKLKLDKSPAAFRRFNLNMRRVYQVLLRRYNAAEKQGPLLSTQYCIINPGIMLNKTLASTNISSLSDKAICELADNSPELPEKSRFHIRTLPIAASIIEKRGITRISYSDLREAFERARIVHSRLWDKNLPIRIKDNRTKINQKIAENYKNIGFWYKTEINDQTCLVNELGIVIGHYDKNDNLIVTDTGYVWIE